MSTTKDKEYWKEYNQKRKDYIQQKNKERYKELSSQRYLKGCINTTNRDTTELKNNTTYPEVVLKKDTTKKELIQPAEKVVKNETDVLQPSLQPKEFLQPKNNTTKSDLKVVDQKENVKPFNCSRCPELEKEKREILIQNEKLRKASQNHTCSLTVVDLNKLWSFA